MRSLGTRRARPVPSAEVTAAATHEANKVFALHFLAGRMLPCES